MNMMKRFLVDVMCLLILAGVALAGGTPEIIEFRDGHITWTNVDPTLYYTVEWVPALTDTNWTGSFHNLQDLQSSAPTMTADVPMFLRIVGHSNAVHTATLSSTTTVMAAGYYAATNLALSDPNLVARNIATNVTIFGIAGALNTNAAAPSYPISLPKTGQATSKQPGDDGTYKKGADWPSPRFTVGTGVDGTNCVTDNLTGLMWARNGNLGGAMVWSNAAAFCENLTYGGYSDWRMPNIRELQSLVNFGAGTPAAWLNGQGFIDVQLDYYWVEHRTRRLGELLVVRAHDHRRSVRHQPNGYLLCVARSWRILESGWPAAVVGPGHATPPRGRRSRRSAVSPVARG